MISVTKEIVNLLADSQWHSFGSILTIIGDMIEPEKATQIYSSQPSKKGDTDLDYRVRMGRRRVILRSLTHLLDSRQVEVKGDGFEREYRKIVVPDNIMTVQKMLEAIDDCDKSFKVLSDAIGNGASLDQVDFAMHCRALRRIIQRR